MQSKTLLSMPYFLLLASCFFSGSANAERTGETLYNTYCIACHINGVAGAPTFGREAEWLPRVEKGIDTLLKNVTTGYKAMPPKGLCFDCSQEELRDAINYMVEHSIKK